MRLINEDDKMEEFFVHDYHVMSLFNPEDAASVENDKIMQSAFEYFEEKMNKGLWHKRDVGWLRVDLSVTPRWALDENHMPEQVLFGL